MEGFLEVEAKWLTLTWFLRPDRYEGEVVNGHMHGKGTYWHADSSRYEGSFCESQRNGYGITKASTKEGLRMATVSLFTVTRQDMKGPFQIMSNKVRV
mmetsp:Transcript_30409/g.91394  ORF Transcript_30409/g.91394 Transcript_30409/m.91394 type:complete len:98 (-) Transcript_30409:478-771(-)